MVDPFRETQNLFIYVVDVILIIWAILKFKICVLNVRPSTSTIYYVTQIST